MTTCDVLILPKLDCSLLVRTDFTSDEVWQQVAGEAMRENEDAFRGQRRDPYRLFNVRYSRK
jgi:hypothetical protein